MRVLKTTSGLHLTWPSTPISVSVYNQIRTEVLATRDYSSADVPDPIHASIRSTLLKDKIIRGYPRMNRQIRQIAKKYPHVDILTLATKYDFPPLNLLRGILLLSYDASDIYSVFSGRGSTKILKKSDREQYKLAAANDAEYYFSQQKIAARGAENERRVVKWFAALTSIRTQEELAAEQIAKHGRAVNTPDVLFVDPVFVNGRRVYWLDFKDYTGTTTKFIFNSNIEQAGRYVAQWGAGVMCYSGGFVEDVVIPDTIITDGRSIGIDYAA